MKPSPSASRRLTLGLLTAMVLLAHGVALQGMRTMLEIRPARMIRPVPLRISTAAMATATAGAGAAAPATPATRPAPSNAVRPVSRRQQAALHTPAPAASDSVASRPFQLPDKGAPATAQRLTRPNAVLIAASSRLLFDVNGTSKGQNISGISELLWQHDERDYEVRWELRLPGQTAREQRSVGSITAEGLAPVRFADKSRTEQAAHFVRDQHRIVFSANAPAVAQLDGAQDRLSVLLQLGAMLAAEPLRFPAGTQLAVQTAGARDAAIWRLTVGEAQRLALPGGTLTAVQLSHEPQSPYEPGLELWLAPDLGYLPVRWRLTYGNGDWIEHQWRAKEAP